MLCQSFCLYLYDCLTKFLAVSHVETRHFPFLCRTHGLVSSAEALGVITDADGDESTRKAEPSPVQDRAARYRLARLRCKTKLLESFNP